MQTKRFFFSTIIYLTMVLTAVGLSAQNLEVEGDAIIRGNGASTNFIVVGPSGEIAFKPFFSPFNGTTLLGEIDGKNVGSPQIRFQSDQFVNFIDIGMDSSGAFVIEQSDNPKIKVNADGSIEVFGRIKNVTNPLAEQDAATKAYVDNILLSFGISLGTAGIQGLLNSGFSPSTIIDNGAQLTDFIGLNHAGGIIFYMDPSGDGTGLVAAPTDQSSAEWGCYGTQIDGADGTAIGTGNQNTIDIEAGCTTDSIAADICANLSLNEFDDWFLPSRDELDEMYKNIGQGAIGQNANIGNFADSFYWSSSEFDDNFAWLQFFSGGSQSSGFKFDNVRVRAIRAF